MSTVLRTTQFLLRRHPDSQAPNRPCRRSRNCVVLLLFLALAANASYTVHTIPVPNVVLEVSGLDYAADGTLYVCTRYGDVWTVKNSTWKRFAWGMHETMGLCVSRDGRIFVSQRPEITELIDSDGDGVADQYNTITDGFSSVPSFHQYTYGLVEDNDGNLCGTLSCTGKTKEDGNPGSSSGFSSEPFRMWSYKVTPDGEFKPWSSGLRTANGIGKNLAGDLFSADNQGDWVGSSMIHHLTEGAFHGNAKALKWDATFPHRDNPEKAPLAELEKLRKMPAIYLPHGELANSPGSPICDTTAGKFGPFAGQMFIGDVLHPNLIRVSLEMVKGQYQGACYPFIKGGALKAGICRLAFSPAGELIVGRVGTGNWGRGQKGEGLQKVVFSGEMPFEIHSIQLMQDGFVLDFTKPVDPAVCAKPELYNIVHYHYKYHAAYGSPKTDKKTVAPSAIELSSDRKRVFVKLADIVPRKVYEFKLPGLVDADGKTLRQHMAYYTLNELSDKTFDPQKPGLSPDPIVPQTVSTSRPKSIAITIDNKPFADYRYVMEEDAPTVTQFFYPLLAPNGANLAADQTRRKREKLPSADHPHHRGLRFSHLYENLSRDYWHKARHHHKRFTKVEGDLMIEELEWEGQKGAVEMKERREFRFFTFPDGARGIDVTLTYRAGDTVPQTIKPMNWMGQNDQIFALMVIRVNPDLGATRVVTAAPGKIVNTAADGPHSKSVDDWRGPWVDFSGTTDGKACGIAFIAHPNNAYPTVWRNNYLQWGIQASLEAKGGISLGADDALVSRYLVVVHDGDATAAQIAEKAAAFRGQK
jgi:hypothetical protein